MYPAPCEIRHVRNGGIRCTARYECEVFLFEFPAKQVTVSYLCVKPTRVRFQLVLELFVQFVFSHWL